MEISKKILQGVYLVIDPVMERSLLLDNVREALEGGVEVLQIWNNWPDDITKAEKRQLVESVCEMATKYEVPVLINDEWQLLNTTSLSGVHFDEAPKDMEQLRAAVDRDIIIGLTCTNNLEVIRRAQQMQADYISFCAMFPSPSAGSCEIVDPDTVLRARRMTDRPLFLSGGITPEKIEQDLAGLPFDGVAVISGIMRSENPRHRVQEYKQALEWQLHQGPDEDQ